MDHYEDNIQQFNDSLDRISDTPFYDVFYQIFLNHSKEISDKFKNTDFNKQKLMLKRSVAYVLNYYIYKKPSERLKKLAIMHSSKQLDIKPEMYDIWLDSIIEALSQCDPRFTKSVEAAWREVMQPGIEAKISTQKAKMPGKD
ncbi:hypothetical protein ACH42_01985 [Endozoicomonas sp. (ex Bugula neritina AB1)]|nr:hypothetical protein ACH42_01985 [Endozoicomonas sp. (ex Bugula neritina AB1)]